MKLRTRIFIVIYLIWSSISEVRCFHCDRRPYGSTTHAMAPDGRFKLLVQGIDDNYMPDQLYTVQIKATDDESRFTGFVISAEGDMKPEPRNPRRLMSMFPGEIRPQSQSTAKFSDRCLYSVEQSVGSMKESVEVYWQAPPSGNGCVTLRAMVSENEEVWFEDGAPLTVRVCEDMRQPDDVAPQINLDCQACDEAKYEVSFTGIWSRNTHPQMYPENDWDPRYSDLVGASHSSDYILWLPGTLATPGLKTLAEHANSSELETEIREKINDGVRTVIKGKGHGYRKMSVPTYSFFRVDKTNHLVTTAVALHPSPDWFLGVTRFELCQTDNTWLPERELNLYPWDAGTDNGVSYESANVETYPQDAVTRVQMSSYDKNSPFYEIDMKDLNPFAKLHIKLIRTYERKCEEETEDGGEQEANENEPEKSPDPEEPSSEAPIETDPDSPEDCPMSQWQEWSLCEGHCEGGKLQGIQWRERYHLVDGVAIEKYDPEKRPSKKEVPEYCKTHYDDFEKEDCEEDCADDVTAEGRKSHEPIAPGHSWVSKRRDTP